MAREVTTLKNGIEIAHTSTGITVKLTEYEGDKSELETLRGEIDIH